MWSGSHWKQPWRFSELGILQVRKMFWKTNLKFYLGLLSMLVTWTIPIQEMFTGHWSMLSWRMAKTMLSMALKTTEPLFTMVTLTLFATTPQSLTWSKIWTGQEQRLTGRWYMMCCHLLSLFNITARLSVKFTTTMTRLLDTWPRWTICTCYLSEMLDTWSL